MPPQKTPPGRKDHSELKAVFVSLVFFILFLFEGGFLGEGKCFRVFFCFYILKVVLKKQIPKQLSGLHLFPKSRTYIYNVVFSSPFYETSLGNVDHLFNVHFHPLSFSGLRLAAPW